MKLHRFGVTVNLDNAHFGAFVARVLVERKQSGFVPLDELHQPGHPLALASSFPALSLFVATEPTR